MKRAFAVVLGLAIAATSPPAVQRGDAADACNAPPAQAQTSVALPGHPFMVVLSRDGCYAFVSLTSSNPRALSGVAVMRRGGGTLQLVRVAPVGGSPSGMSLTADGRVLAVADDDFLVFLDVARLISGAGDPILGYGSDGAEAQTVDAAISPDDRFVFATDENLGTITVVDFARTRADGYRTVSVIGKIPVENAPTRMVFSPDGATLYVTSEIGSKRFSDPKVCSPEGSPPGTPAQHPEGVLLAIDVATAAKDPAHAVVGRALAGCSPVRVALNPDGTTAWVSVRHGDRVLAFDTKKLRELPAAARIADVPVGKGPIGLIVARNGTLVLAGNADRFSEDQTTTRTISVIDAAKALAGAPAVIRTISAGGVFPREFTRSADERELILANYASDTLTLFDVSRL